MGPKPDGNFFISDKNIDCRRFTNIWITNHTNSNIFFIETELISTFFFSRITKRVSKGYSLSEKCLDLIGWEDEFGEILGNRDSVLWNIISTVQHYKCPMNLKEVQLVLFLRFLHPRLPLLPNLLSEHQVVLEVFLLLLILSLPLPKVDGQIKQ